jgi:hypothetical protein
MFLNHSAQTLLGIEYVPDEQRQHCARIGVDLTEFSDAR